MTSENGVNIDINFDHGKLILMNDVRFEY